MWKNILPSFKETHTVYALDLPGFGDNQKKYIIFSLDDFVDHINNFFFTNNIESAIFVGHSFGGRIATLFAIRYPKKVDKLVLYSSSIPSYETTLSQLSLLRNCINTNLVILFSLVTRGLKNKQVLLSDYKQLSNIYKNSRSKAYFHKKLHHIKHPVLLMAGRFDFLVTLQYQKNLLKHFHNAELVIFNRSTHIAHVEENIQFIATLKKFILTSVPMC